MPLTRKESERSDRMDNNYIFMCTHTDAAMHQMKQMKTM